MPCKTCELMFNVNPCVYHRKDPLDEMLFPPVKPNRFHQDLYEFRFLLLYNKCPCKVCLVRSICVIEFCEEYMNILNRANYWHNNNHSLDE
jgi:hypothetical protein